MTKYRVLEAVIEHPFEMFTGFLCFLAGLPVLIRQSQPGSIIAALPIPLQFSWGGALTIGGLLVLSGLLGRAFSPRWFRQGLLVERGGLLLLSTATGVYAFVLMLYAPFNRSLVTALLLVALSLACVARSFAITRMMHRLDSPNVGGADDASN